MAFEGHGLKHGQEMAETNNMKRAATTTSTSIFTQFAVENRVIEDCPFPRELVMEAVLAENPQLLSMSTSLDRTSPEILELEKPLVKGRNVKDGRIDIVVYYPDDSMVGIVELKREVAGIKALEQLKEYTQKALDIFEDLKNGPRGELFADRSADDLSWMAILCAPNIDEEVKSALLGDGDSVSAKGIKAPIPIAALELKRYFDSAGSRFYYIANALQKHGRSRQKYTVDGGEALPKNRSVLKAVELFCNRKNPNRKELLAAFPDDIRNVYGVFKEKSWVEREGKEMRYFMDCPLELRDGSIIVVCNQWGTEKDKKGKLCFAKLVQAARKVNIVVEKAE